ncbi:MAG: metallophosphoesterase [Clostridia bacterium]|nr:metallophosphoesterase [Clostridia bacterium]
MNRFVKMQRELQQWIDSGKVPMPDASTPIEPDPSARLTFAVWGDPQIYTLSPVRSAKFYAACRDLANMCTPLDALIFAGDIAENGDAAEYRMVSQILRDVCPNAFRHFLCVPGNHDVRLKNYVRQVDVFNRFIASVPGGIPSGDAHHCHTVRMRGYTFLLMGSDASTFEGAYIGTRQLRWIDEELYKANGKPVFIINHQTLHRTNGLPKTWLGRGSWRGSVGWQSDALREVFERYRNVIFITGHLHYGTSRYTYEDHGAFKALSVPTISVVNHGICTADTQGYVLSVYDDRILAKARIFGEGRYLEKERDNAQIIIPIER